MLRPDATQAPEPLRKPAAPVRAEGVRRPSVRPSRGRRIARGFLITLGLLTAIVVVVTQSGLLRVLVVPRVEAWVGAKVTAGRTTIDRGGVLVIRKPALDAPRPDLSPSAARFVQAEELRLQINWRALLSGRLELQRLELLRPVIRVTQGEDLRLNIKEVVEHLAASPPSGSISRLPELRVEEATIEFGEHAPGPPATYKELTSLRVSGTIRPDPAAANRYVVDFFEEKAPVQTPQGADPLLSGKRPGLASSLTSPKMKVSGTISVNPISADLQLTNVDLAEVGRRQAPSWFEEVWSELRLGGEIPRVRFGYEPKRGLSVSFDVKGVDMNVPVPVEADLDAAGDPVPGAEASRRLMAMRDVSGVISLDARGVSAELIGTIEDSPLTVRVRTDGRELNSALSCDLESRGFLVSKRPKLLPFAPPFVRFLFQRLGGPTAEAEGVVKLRREQPLPDGSPGAIRVSGTLKIKNGTAAHELFRYPVSQLSGVVNFDDAKVELNLKGSNPNGTKLLASGVVSPPDETAAATIDITVVDIPVDEQFREALPEKRRLVFDALLDRGSYDAFRSEGLLQSSQDREQNQVKLNELRTNLAMGERFGGGAERMAQMRHEAEDLEKKLGAPVFDLGGTASMQIAVTRALGAEAETKADVHLTADRLGLMLRAFPLPLVASNVDMELGGSTTTMKPISISTPSGGAGLVTGRVDYPDGGGLFPFVNVQASRVPLDEVFVRALPSRADPRKVTARRLVGGLGFEGTIDGLAVVRPDPNDPESASFRIDIAASGLTARPGDGSVELTELHGGVSVFDGAVEIPYLAGLIDGAPFELDAGAWYGGDGPTSLFGAMKCRGLDLARSFEQILLAAAPETAAEIVGLRSSRRPLGCVDGEVAFMDPGGSPAASIRVDSLSGGSFEAPGGRTELVSASGRLEVTSQATAFDRFVIGAPGGASAELNGALALDDRTATSLGIAAAGARFESPLVRDLAALAGSEVAAFILESDPRGSFDAQVTHTRNTTGPGSRGSEGWLEPRSLILNRRGVPVVLDSMSGRFVFSKGAGRFEKLTAQAASWWASADGTYQLEPAFGMDLTLSVEGEAIAKDLRAALPVKVSEALDTVELGEEGRVSMKDAVIRVVPGGASKFHGAVALSGVTLKPVVPITGAEGVVDVSAVAEPGGAMGSRGPLVELDIRAGSFKLAGVRMTSGRAKLIADPEGGVRVPLFEAQCHGGRLSARGGLDAPVGTSGQPRRFSFSADLSTIRFGDFLADLYPKTVLDESRGGETNVDRGYLDGSFSIAGDLGDVNSRRGRGLLRVQDGEVLNMPAVVPILKLSNLQPPVNERIGFGYADFYVQGDRLRFDELTLQSKSLAIDGRGVVSWPGLEVDLRFVTRSLNRVPLLTDLLEGVRDELVTTTVSGTLYDPSLKYEQLTATRQVLDQIFSKKRRDDPPAPSSDQPARSPEP